MMTTLDGFPAKFESDEDACDTFDTRTYCQMVEQDDPLHFAWQTYVSGDDVVVCGGFETEACIIANWTGSWNFAADFGSVAPAQGNISIGNNAALATQSQVATQQNILSNGCWKITIVIPHYPYPFIGNLFDDTFEHQEYVGNFFIRAGNWTSQATPVTPGTHIFYAEITSGDDLTIVPDNAIIVVTEVKAEPICCDYSILVKSNAGEVIGIFNDDDFIGNEGIFREQDVMYLKTTWSSFDLEEGCYQVCIINNCGIDGSEWVQNGDLASESGWVYLAGFSWTYDGVNDEFDHAVAAFPELPLRAPLLYTLQPNTSYIVTYQIKNYSAGSIKANIGGGGEYPGISRSANGTFTEVISVGGTLTTSAFSFLPSATFVGSIDNVSLTETETDCSQCYDLKENHECTKLLEWYSDDDAFGIPYSGMLGSAYSLDYANFLRVTALIEKPRYPQESDRFVYSDGTRKILYATSEKIWTLALDYLPQYLHDAIALAKIHDHFYIDDVEYICIEGNYEPEWRNRLRLAQSKIEIQKVVDNNKNKNC